MGHPRYKADMDADNTRSTNYVDAASPEEAAKKAIRGWRYDTTMHGKPSTGTDLYGPYTRFVFKAGRRFASIKIRESVDNQDRMLTAWVLCALSYRWHSGQWSRGYRLGCVASEYLRRFGIGPRSSCLDELYRGRLPRLWTDDFKRRFLSRYRQIYRDHINTF